MTNCLGRAPGASWVRLVSGGPRDDRVSCEESGDGPREEKDMPRISRLSKDKHVRMEEDT
jgi:hypothetical protein